jgi:hypothetical protein
MGVFAVYQVQVNKNTLQNHIHYDWWKYLVGVIATIFIWSMVTTMTRPQTPPEKKVDIFLVGDYVIDESLISISDEILKDFPDLLEINFNTIPLTGEMEYVGRQKLQIQLE